MVDAGHRPRHPAGVRRAHTLLPLAVALLLAACSGGSGGSSPDGGSVAPPVQQCSLAARQQWAEAQMREWYLFPETLPASINPSAFSSVSGFLDALTATARAEGRDRSFTYLASIAEEDAYYASGQTAAFGIRIMTDTAARTVSVLDAYEGAPGLAAGIDRGARILAIGTTPGNLRTVEALIAEGGSAAVSDALGPSTPGITRSIRFLAGGVERTVSISKANFDILPVSPRYGVAVLEVDGRPVGYLNLRTFIGTADPALRAAFQRFRAEGVRDVIVDVRYNGGGLVRIAELMGDLLGGNRAPTEIFSRTRYRAEKSALDSVRTFQPQPQSIAADRIAFITTGSSASASELVVNSFVPWLRERAILVGGNSYGKPVGQIARDRAPCDDRLRVVAFESQNVDRIGGYYSGLASVVAASCAATDDPAQPMGAPAEAMTAAALGALAGQPCTPIAHGARTAERRAAAAPELPVPSQPTPAQRDLPGTF